MVEVVKLVEVVMVEVVKISEGGDGGGGVDGGGEGGGGDEGGGEDGRGGDGGGGGGGGVDDSVHLRLCIFSGGSSSLDPPPDKCAQGVFDRGTTVVITSLSRGQDKRSGVFLPGWAGGGFEETEQYNLAGFEVRSLYENVNVELGNHYAMLPHVARKKTLGK